VIENIIEAEITENTSRSSMYSDKKAPKEMMMRESMKALSTKI